MPSQQPHHPLRPCVLIDSQHDTIPANLIIHTNENTFPYHVSFPSSLGTVTQQQQQDYCDTKQQFRNYLQWVLHFDYRVIDICSKLENMQMTILSRHLLQKTVDILLEALDRAGQSSGDSANGQDCSSDNQVEGNKAAAATTSQESEWTVVKYSSKGRKRPQNPNKTTQMPTSNKRESSLQDSTTLTSHIDTTPQNQDNNSILHLYPREKHLDMCFINGLLLGYPIIYSFDPQRDIQLSNLPLTKYIVSLPPQYPQVTSFTIPSQFLDSELDKWISDWMLEYFGGQQQWAQKGLQLEKRQVCYEHVIV